jgi:hypothetical protein
MPQEEEELDVNELKGSNQITKETRMLLSNDQNISTTFGSIDNILHLMMDRNETMNSFVLKAKTPSKTC